MGFQGASDTFRDNVRSDIEILEFRITSVVTDLKCILFQVKSAFSVELSKPLHLTSCKKITAFTVYHYSFSYAVKFVETPVYKLIERHCPPHTLDKEGRALCCEGFYRFDGDSYLDDQCFRKFKTFSLIL